MRNAWLIAAAAVFFLGAIGALCAPPVKSAGATDGAALARRADGSTISTNDSRPATRPADVPLLVGFAINFHHTDELDRYLKAIDELHDMGFNSLEVLTPAFQRDGAAEEIGVKVGPGLSPRREDLVRLLKHARKRGMVTKLMPLVLLSEPRGNEWRGRIQPENWDRWWKSYRKNLDYFLDIANEADASVFSVGSELLSTEKHADRWKPLIAHARSRFKGLLSYSTNWDHYEVPTFWSDLDLIGINGYWDLTTLADNKDAPKPDELVTRWKEIRGQVTRFGESVKKPVLLTEIGYPSLPWALKDPWNYINSKDLDNAPGPQAAGYRAFLDAWGDVLAREAKPSGTGVQGVFFFQWDVYYNGGKDDTGYGVRGKPAQELLRGWLKSRDAR